MLAVFEGFSAKARQIKGEVSGSVQIATVDDSDFLRLGDLLYGLRTALPLLQFRTRLVPADDVVDGILNADFDAGFHIGNIDHPDIGLLPLRSIAYLVAGPASYADRLSRAGWNDVAGMPWVTPPERSHVARFLRGLFAQHGAQIDQVRRRRVVTEPHGGVTQRIPRAGPLRLNLVLQLAAVGNDMLRIDQDVRQSIR